MTGTSLTLALQKHAFPARQTSVFPRMQDFYRFLKDDAALLRASDARWLLVPYQTQSLFHSTAVNGAGPHPEDGADEPEGTTHLGKDTHIHGLRIAFPEEAIEIGDGLLVGSGTDMHIRLESPMVSRPASPAELASAEGPAQ